MPRATIGWGSQARASSGAAWREGGSVILPRIFYSNSRIFYSISGYSTPPVDILLPRIFYSTSGSGWHSTGFFSRLTGQGLTGCPWVNVYYCALRTTLLNILMILTKYMSQQTTKKFLNTLGSLGPGGFLKKPLGPLGPRCCP